MPPFRFSLQQVLEYRIQLEDQAKTLLAQIQAERMAAERRLEELQAQLLEQEQSLYSDNLDMQERWLREHYVKGLRADIAHTSTVIAQLFKQVEAARAELVVKSKERKILDKFKEKQAQRHAHEELLQEQRTYDEIASTRFKAATF